MSELSYEYSKHEHNHTQWTDEQLHDEVMLVQAQVDLLEKSGTTSERLEQQKRRLALVTFEQIQRYAERHPSKKNA
jgi:hypothetical protein